MVEFKTIAGLMPAVWLAAFVVLFVVKKDTRMIPYVTFVGGRSYWNEKRA